MFIGIMFWGVEVVFRFGRTGDRGHHNLHFKQHSCVILTPFWESPLNSRSTWTISFYLHFNFQRHLRLITSKMQLFIPSKFVCHPPNLPNLSKWLHIPLVIHTRNLEAILDSLLFLLATSNPLYSEKAMAPYSSTLAWKIPWMEEPWWAAVHGVAKSQTWLSAFTFTFQFHASEKEMATHSSVLAWRIPGTAEPGGLPSMGSHRVGHEWSDLAAAAIHYLTKSFFKMYLKLLSLHIYCSVSRSVVSDSLQPHGRQLPP